MAKSDRVTFRDAEALSHEAAKRFVKSGAEAIARRGRFLAVLSGGRTSQRTYEQLAEKPFRDEADWDKIHLFLTDERFVPFDHPDSNFGLIQKLLLSKINLPASNLHPFCVEAPSLEKAAQDTEKSLLLFFGKTGQDFPCFDLIFLGMGADGHVAGIFPGTEAFREKEKWVVFSKGAGGFSRLSLSLPVLNAAESIVMLVTGEEKAKMVARVSENDTRNLPAGSVYPQTGVLSWFLDQAAASRLEKER